MGKFSIKKKNAKMCGENPGKRWEDYRRAAWKTDAEGMVGETTQLISRCGPG